MARRLILMALLVLPTGNAVGARVGDEPVPPSLSVMSYNVHGLPWPMARGRPAALEAIAADLHTLRLAGRQPHLVALQEAFVPDAKAIGRRAGYRYFAFGPGQNDAPAPQSRADRAFAEAGSYWKGEKEGKRADSGLAIFSDYPITAVRRVAYGTCAGFDCLSNKGAMAALVTVPGLAAPVTFVNTHLNSNHASFASDERAIYAYRRQIDMFGAFVANVAPAGSQLLIAGDFNVGITAARRAYFSSRLLGGRYGLSAVQLNCWRGSSCVAKEDAGLRLSLMRARDWLLYRSSAASGFVPIGLSAPFGPSADGSMLSDHVGIVAAYRMSSGLRGSGTLIHLASR
jgi:endonuclease/exonuclease/phosphatase family metal-dependent hydrolase